MGFSKLLPARLLILALRLVRDTRGFRPQKGFRASGCRVLRFRARTLIKNVEAA